MMFAILFAAATLFYIPASVSGVDLKTRVLPASRHRHLHWLEEWRVVLRRLELPLPPYPLTTSPAMPTVTPAMTTRAQHGVAQHNYEIGQQQTRTGFRVGGIEWQRRHGGTDKSSFQTQLPVAAARKLQVQPQIVGGTPSYNEFPSVAYLLLDGSYICGGALISGHCILTAAHCIEGTSEFKATLGTSTPNQASASRQIFTSRNASMHESYNTSTLYNDIGVIYFVDVIRQTAYIKYSTLPTEYVNTTLAGLLVTAVGWGKKSDKSDTSETLLKATLKVISNTECYNRYRADIVIASTLCCDRPTKTKVGTCGGDSGSPLFFKESSGRLVMIALASFVSTDGCVKAPSGCVRVSTFLSWINKKLVT